MYGMSEDRVKGVHVRERSLDHIQARIRGANERETARDALVPKHKGNQAR